MKTLKAFEADFPNEDACKKLLAECRWPDGPVCPRCGNTKIITLKSKPHHWVCKSGIDHDRHRRPAGNLREEWRLSFQRHHEDDLSGYENPARHLVSRCLLDADQQEGNQRTTGSSHSVWRRLRLRLSDKLVYVSSAPLRDAWRNRTA